MANTNLTSAKKSKNDEFYTQFSDIQKEVEAYLEYDANVFRGKIVYCNCDDPFESNFFRYFVLNFNKLGLKQLITTSYKPSSIANTQFGLFTDDKSTPAEYKGLNKITANKFIINEVNDTDNDGEFNLKDVSKQLKENKNNEWKPLEGDGDFRSHECIDLLIQSDIVVTNPPFSLFRQFIKQLVDYEKKFLVIGNMNAITYKEIFPLLKANKIWLGNNYKVNGGAMFFEIPEKTANLEQVREIKDENGKKVYMTRVQGIRWFTNLEHGRRHQPIPLMTESDVIKFATKKQFIKYDNYNATEIELVKNIPSDFNGVMGVPISIMDKYCPEQFEIVGATESEGKGFSNGLWLGGVSQALVKNQKVYKRIFIKHKK